jgi:hypothetical protein
MVMMDWFEADPKRDLHLLGTKHRALMQRFRNWTPPPGSTHAVHTRPFQSPSIRPDQTWKVPRNPSDVARNPWVIGGEILAGYGSASPSAWNLQGSRRVPEPSAFFCRNEPSPTQSIGRTAHRKSRVLFTKDEEEGEF